MVSHNNEIIAQVLSMTDKQLAVFLKSLNPESLEYLDVILEKAETRTLSKLMQYIESQ